MFKDLPEGQTYSCEKHVWDSEELNPRCHICGLLMRDDSVQSESIDWEKEFDVFLQDVIDAEKNWGYGDPEDVDNTKSDIKDFVKDAITTAVAKDRQRIFGLPCMEEEKEGVFVDERNDLRRELKEEINI